MYDNQVLEVSDASAFFVNRKPRSRAAIIHHTEYWQLHVNNIVICFLIPIARRASETTDERCDPIPGRFVELAEEIIAFIWNGHSAFIWVNGAEGEIFSCSLTLCQHVEKGWLPENKNSIEANLYETTGVRSATVWQYDPEILVNYARLSFFSCTESKRLILIDWDRKSVV